MSICVSLINMKGGVGKSTLTVNLAWHFAAYDVWLKKVLVIDLDPQFNASQYLLGAHRYKKILNNNTPTIWNLFTQYNIMPTAQTGSPVTPTEAISPVARIRGGGEIDLLPSRLELAFALKQHAIKHFILKNFIDSVKENYDLVLIDCAPTESLATDAAYYASDFILVPVKPEYLSTIGLPLLAQSLKLFNDQYNQKPNVCGIVFNAVTNYSPEELKSKKEVKYTASEFDWQIFENQIPYSRSYPKGAREGEPIFRTSYARSEQAEHFASFAAEFAARIGL